MEFQVQRLRRGAAALLGSLLLCLGAVACHKHHDNDVPGVSSFKVSGTVSYTRIPLHYASGVPTGLETDSTKFITGAAARGITVRIFQRRPQTNLDYSTSYGWVQVGSATTDASGYYELDSGALIGYETFVELTSTMTQPNSPASTVAIVGDPAGVYSSKNIRDRVIYVMRKALDGTSSSSDATHSTMGSGDAVVDFKVGLTDPWMLTIPKWWIPTGDVFPYPETVSAGSSILAILDTAYYVSAQYGNAVPSAGVAELDLHYRPGLTTRRGTFVEYNPKTFPKAYDGSSYRFFGSVAAGGTVDGVAQADDAFDTGTLYPIFTRNRLVGEGMAKLMPTGFPQTNLMPDLALIEGMGDGSAAVLLQSPYLASRTPGNHYNPPRDIRDLSALSADQIGPFSAPAIAALTWQLALTNTGISGTGTATDWANMVPVNLNRFYTLITPTLASGTATVASDCTNILVQLARLQETKGSSDNSDLAAYFGDSVLTPLCKPFNLTWTNSTDADTPRYMSTWNTDPDTLVTPLPSFSLSMDHATQIPVYSFDDLGDETVTMAYPNNSAGTGNAVKGEVLYATFPLTLDRNYNLKVETIPDLPAGASLEVVVDYDLENAYYFLPGAGTVVPLRLAGNPSDLSTPVWHAFRVRLVSPTVKVPSTLVTVKLEKTSS